MIVETILTDRTHSHTNCLWRISSQWTLLRWMHPIDPIIDSGIDPIGGLLHVATIRVPRRVIVQQSKDEQQEEEGHNDVDHNF